MNRKPQKNTQESEKQTIIRTRKFGVWYKMQIWSLKEIRQTDRQCLCMCMNVYMCICVLASCMIKTIHFDCTSVYRKETKANKLCMRISNTGIPARDIETTSMPHRTVFNKKLLLKRTRYTLRRMMWPSALEAHNKMFVTLDSLRRRAGFALKTFMTF